MNNCIVTSVSVLCVIFSAIQTAFAQGPLTPPGAPAPTMKTLQQVEPRTPISSAPYTITASGSYYLTTNQALGSISPAIVVLASNVTIDLNGFTIGGTNVEDVSAIKVLSSGSVNLTVRNGSVINCLNAIDATNATTCLIEDVSCYFIYNNAVAVGPGSVVRNCTVRTAAASGGGNGILTGDGSIVEHCALFNDTGLHNGHAISVGGNCLVDSCVASNFFLGIVTGNGCTIKACNASFQSGFGIQAGSGCTIHSCTVYGNGDYGILTGDSCTVQGCTAVTNEYDGIVVTSYCSVINNTADGNGNTGGAGTDGGIQATGNGNRIDSNHTFANNCDGILVSATASNNVVIRNTSNYNAGFQFRVPGIPTQPPAGANIVGNIVTDATNANANAWANFQ
jgi:parallel beta-helix repeat protein